LFKNLFNYISYLFKQLFEDSLALNLLINNKLDDQYVNPVDPENPVLKGSRWDYHVKKSFLG